MSNDAFLNHDPHAEMSLLYLACKLLRQAEQLSNADKKLIAGQVRNVLLTGLRQPDPEQRRDALAEREDADDTPVDYALDDELLKSHSAPCDYAERYEPYDTPEPKGFTVPERIAALGWHGSPAGVFQTHVCRVTKLVREAWRNRYSGEPIHKGEEDWYMELHAGWIDAIITTYLAIVPAVAQAQQPVHIPEGN